MADCSLMEIVMRNPFILTQQELCGGVCVVSGEESWKRAFEDVH